MTDLRLASAVIGAALLAMAGPTLAQTKDIGTKPPCTDKSRACLERIARSYIDGLTKHDGSAIPLSPTVRRTENALTNARGAYEARESFIRTHMVKAARDIRLYTDVEKGEVIAFFRLDVDLAKEDATATTKSGDTEYHVATTVPAGTYTVHEAERFKIVNGYITEIEIIAHVEKGRDAGSGWPVERKAEVKK